jgi:hypothetical protein
MTNSRASLRSGNCPISIGIGVRFGSEQVSAFIGIRKPARPGDASNFTPEFLRTDDVRRIFGIRRGSLYGLFQLGAVKSCLLRIRGNKLGVRLWSVDSIRSHIREQMEAAENHQAQ